MFIRTIGRWAISLLVALSGPCADAQGTAGVDACSLESFPANDSLVRMPFDVVDGRVHVQEHVMARVRSGSPWIPAQAARHAWP